jgi:hypothetical protein
MLHQWREVIFEMEQEKVEMDSNNVKFEKESAKVKMESDKLEMFGKVQMDMVKFEKESAKVEADSVKLEVEADSVKLEVDHKGSISNMETNDEGCWFEDGVELRGYSQVEDDDFNE